MFARGPQWNVSCFRKDGTLPIHEVMIEYLKLAVEMDMPYVNIKYVLMQMRLPEEVRITRHREITV